MASNVGANAAKSFKELDSEERKRLVQLYKERQQQQKQGDGKLDWMYKKPTVDTDAYLLGKRIDKIPSATELVEGTSAEDPGAIFANNVVPNSAIDLANKIREDPLFAIKKKEQEQKRKLLENPVKMKQLQDMLQKSKEKSKAKKKKEKKKKSKSKKNQSSSSSSSSEEEEEQKETSSSGLHELIFSPRLDPHYSKKYGLEERSSPKRDEKPKADYKRPELLEWIEKRRNQRNPKRARSPSPPKPRRKLTAEEMEEKRRKMMANAQWRDDVRSSNVKRYQEKAKEEDEVEEKNRGKAAEFIAPLVQNAYASAEDRIKRNIYNIQRTGAALDKNFTKR